MTFVETEDIVFWSDLEKNHKDMEDINLLSNNQAYISFSEVIKGVKLIFILIDE